tara:strand:+ start:4948 stop:5376 length:429 start_codon:yes stop_codon:yes gene_type:complete
MFIKYLFPFFSFFSIVHSFNNPSPIENHSFFPFHDSILLSNNNNIFDNLDSSHFKSFLEHTEKDIGKFTVLKISSLLPHFDSIGHKILHANNEFVVQVLANPHISDSFKKDLILNAIKLAQHGDDFGSQLLQMYYDIVDYSL